MIEQQATQLGIDKSPDYYDLDRTELFDFVKQSGLKLNGAILNVGCAAGGDADNLRAMGATKLYGIEPVAAAAELAAKQYDEVFHGVLEDAEWDGTPLELVIFADVLEHLVDPSLAIKQVSEWLSPTGRILISVPNVRHITVIADLVFRGDWKYIEHGIMDATHLRFFTKKSFTRLLDEAQFEIESFDRWGMMSLTRKISKVIPPAGEFLLSSMYFVAKPR